MVGNHKLVMSFLADLNEFDSDTNGPLEIDIVKEFEISDFEP